jgi:poly [ADP-ribose] polymerase
MAKAIKLIMVETDGTAKVRGNNKYYNMEDLGNGQFIAKYGRVGNGESTAQYPIHQWDTKYREKIRKGCKDVTHLFLEEAVDTNTPTKDKQTISSKWNQMVRDVVSILQSYARGSVTKNYNVSSANVTQRQVDEAQSKLNSLISMGPSSSSIVDLNRLLLEFYMIIPRKMDNVHAHVLPKDADINVLDTKLKNILSEEQMTLDVMAGQVKLKDVSNAVDVDEETDILTVSGLMLEPVNAQEEQMLRKMMGSDAGRYHRAFRVTNFKTKKALDEYKAIIPVKNMDMLWHGSRNENWWSIMTSGLLIRPSNAIHTGSMLGDGVYFANKMAKSAGYTSLRGSYWASGSDNRGFLAIYNVLVGNPYHIHQHTSDCYNLCKKKLQLLGNYDSVHAHAGISLRNDEIVIYDSNQSTIEYLIECR